MALTNCTLVYLDVGSNIGDSLQAFAHRKPEARLRETMRAAVGDGWSARSICAYGFEPNPQHTPRLNAAAKKLAPLFHSLTVYTETAVGGPEQVARPMWLTVAGGAKGVGSFLTTQKPASGEARPVRTVRMSSWLRDVCLPRHGARTPVVMRIDVEGVEYDMLSDLAVSGVGQQMDLFLTLEWHRKSAAGFLGPAELEHMEMLDHRFLRYPNRCGDGSCALSVGQNSTLHGSLEKTLAFMLHRAGITYVDAFFDILPKAGKVPSPQEWGRTRQKRREVEEGLRVVSGAGDVPRR